MHLIKPLWLNHGGRKLSAMLKREQNITDSDAQVNYETTKYTVVMYPPMGRD
jgi:hypothetical protein